VLLLLSLLLPHRWWAAILCCVSLHQLLRELPPWSAVIHADFVSLDGSSNWLLGLQLVGTYALISLLCACLPLTRCAGFWHESMSNAVQSSCTLGCAHNMP
jgi:hypothetical protein